jgi:5-(carboxyamino)imidazole ribonucleotide mutase
MAKPVVGILMGSDSDLPVMQEAAAMLQEFGIEYEMSIASAHRTPKSDGVQPDAENAGSR